MSLISRLSRAARITLPGDALYRRIVDIARTPEWFIAGAVHDSVDGRFDMVAAVLSLVLRRLEAGGETVLPARLTERFIDDMDGSLRQMGVGDQVVGKHVGRMVSALGGRLGAYRDALAPDAETGALRDAVARNIYRGEAVDAPALDWLVEQLRGLATRIDTTPLAAIIAGQVPA